MSLPTRTIDRAALIQKVRRIASDNLSDREQREAVEHYVAHAPRVAVGSYNLAGCRCPISGAGVDRMHIEAQDFVHDFDDVFGIEVPIRDCYILEVTD